MKDSQNGVPEMFCVRQSLFGNPYSHLKLTSAHGSGRNYESNNFRRSLSC